MAACPRLTELSVISPYPYYNYNVKGAGVLLDPGGEARPTMSGLIIACKALQDFNTLQIVRFPMEAPSLDRWCDDSCECGYPNHPIIWEQILEQHVKDLGWWAIECLKKVKAECLEGEERKRITLRTVEFSYMYPVQVKRCDV